MTPEQMQELMRIAKMAGLGASPDPVAAFRSNPTAAALLPVDLHREVMQMGSPQAPPAPPPMPGATGPAPARSATSGNRPAPGAERPFGPPAPPQLPAAPAAAPPPAATTTSTANVRQPTGDEIADGYYSMYDQGRLLMEEGMKSNDPDLIKEGQDMMDTALKGLTGLRKPAAGGGSGSAAAFAQLQLDWKKFEYQQEQDTLMTQERAGEREYRAGRDTVLDKRADDAATESKAQFDDNLKNGFLKWLIDKAGGFAAPGGTAPAGLEAGGMMDVLSQRVGLPYAPPNAPPMPTSEQLQPHLPRALQSGGNPLLGLMGAR